MNLPSPSLTSLDPAESEHAANVPLHQRRARAAAAPTRPRILLPPSSHPAPSKPTRLALGRGLARRGGGCNAGAYPASVPLASLLCGEKGFLPLATTAFHPVTTSSSTLGRFHHFIGAPPPPPPPLAVPSATKQKPHIQRNEGRWKPPKSEFLHQSGGSSHARAESPRSARRFHCLTRP